MQAIGLSNREKHALRKSELTRMTAVCRGEHHTYRGWSGIYLEKN